MARALAACGPGGYRAMPGDGTALGSSRILGLRTGMRRPSATPDRRRAGVRAAGSPCRADLGARDRPPPRISAFGKELADRSWQHLPDLLDLAVLDLAGDRPEHRARAFLGVQRRRNVQP